MEKKTKQNSQQERLLWVLWKYRYQDQKTSEQVSPTQRISDLESWRDLGEEEIDRSIIVCYLLPELRCAEIICKRIDRSIIAKAI